MRHAGRLWPLACAAVALLGLGALSAPTDEGTRLAVRIGPAIRTDMKVRIAGSSYVQSLGLHAAAPRRDSFVAPPCASICDNPGEYADRSFDDGFVFIDPSTVDFGGDTWFWGYESAGQYDPVADTLSLHLNGITCGEGWDEVVRVDTTRDEAVDLSDRLDGSGLAVSVDWLLRQGDRHRVLLQFGCLWLDGIDYHAGAEPYAERITEERYEAGEKIADVTYVYDLMGVIPPPAPYAGTYEGPGPLLPNLPADYGWQSTDAEPTYHSRSMTAMNTISFDLEARLFELWAGPRFEWTLDDQWKATLTAFASLDYVDMTVDRNETWLIDSGSGRVLANWHDRVEEATWKLGGGIRGGARAELSDRWFVELEAGYDWVPDDAEIPLGPNTVRLNVSGYHAGAAVGCTLW